MALIHIKCCFLNFLVLFLFLFTTSVSASTFLSDGVFGSPDSTGRSLLQVKKACPVNFEFQNYTIITSKCKGPLYSPALCCGAFKEFACPFYDELNDLSNDCASTMFSYINLYGKYPPGLFASECRDSKDGLDCTSMPPSPSLSEKTEKASAGKIICNLFSMPMLVTASLVLLL